MQNAPHTHKYPIRVSTIAVLAILSFAAIGAIQKHKISNDSVIKLHQLKNWGLGNARSQSHISAIDAWKLEKGSKNIIVAVIDTGLDADHPDLKKNVWRNGKNDYGFNFVTQKANPTDDHGHGTHVAGIIGAVANPTSGVSGVVQNVSIMSVKYYSDSNPGSVNLKNTIRAIEYAVENGAKIINYSGGGPEFSQEEYLAIKKAEAKGVLFIAAAGNEKQDSDLPQNYYYPSAYKLPNIISVAATDIHNKLLRSSNWGKVRVDVTAPGENIYSTLPGGRYGYMSGTSQATAFVTGIAALLLSRDPSLSPAKIKELIRGSADVIPELKDKIASGGRVNAYKALLALGIEAPKPEKENIIRSLARGPSAFLESLSQQ